MKSGTQFITCISIMNLLKRLQRFNQIIIIMEQNMILIRDPKTLYFDGDENLKHKIEFIIKIN